MCFTLSTQVTMFCEPLAGLFLDFLYALSPPRISCRTSALLSWITAKFCTSLFKKDQDRRQSTDVKEGTHKTGGFKVIRTFETKL